MLSHDTMNYLYRLFRKDLFQNILALYGVHLANYVFPILNNVYLARVLGAEELGILAFTQAFSAYFSMLIEFGFGFSATRQIARNRDIPSKQAEIVSGVLGAKIVLSILGLGVFLLIAPHLPLFKERPEILWAGLLQALIFAFNPIWYFQGLERMRLIASLEVGSKVLVFISLLLGVKDANSAWKVLVLYGMGHLLVNSICMYIVYREVPWHRPNLKRTIEYLRSGSSMFFGWAATSIYTTSNVFILGLFIPSKMVGYYAVGEKINRAFVGLISPLSRALYPRMSRLTQLSAEEMTSFFWTCFINIGCLGLALGAGSWLSAPLVVRMFLGEEFDAAIPVLQILSFTIPIIAVSNVLGIQWMFPLGLERAFNIIVLIAGLLNILLATLLVPRFSYLGMAWAVLITETFVTSALVLYLVRRRLLPVIASQCQMR